MKTGFERVYESALTQNPEMLTKLFAEGICIDEFEPGNIWYSAAAKHAANNNLLAVEFLMEHGANPNFVAFAAGKKNRAIGERLVNGHFAHPSYFAAGLAFAGEKDLCLNLLERGAQKDWIATWAMLGGHEDFSKFMQKEHNAEIFWEFGPYPYFDRAYGNRLLARGMKINGVAYLAGQHHQIDYALELIANNADSQCVANGAAYSGHRQLAERFTTGDLKSLALAACEGGHRDYFQYLLSCGVKRSEACLTFPLSRHLSNNQEQVIQFLSFIKPQFLMKILKDLQNFRPTYDICYLFVACTIIAERRAEKLGNRNANSIPDNYSYPENVPGEQPDRFGIACKNGNIAEVKVLLESGQVNPAEVNNYALRHACMNGHKQIVNLLLSDERIDPLVSNNLPLQLAADNKHIPVMLLLLCNPKVQQQGLTLLLTHMKNPEQKEIVQQQHQRYERFVLFKKVAQTSPLKDLENTINSFLYRLG